VTLWPASCLRESSIGINRYEANWLASVSRAWSSRPHSIMSRWLHRNFVDLIAMTQVMAEFVRENEVDASTNR
jgi:hypothetical protein